MSSPLHERSFEHVLSGLKVICGCCEHLVVVELGESHALIAQEPLQG